MSFWFFLNCQQMTLNRLTLTFSNQMFVVLKWPKFKGALVYIICTLTLCICTLTVYLYLCSLYVLYLCYLYVLQESPGRTSSSSPRPAVRSGQPSSNSGSPMTNVKKPDPNMKGKRLRGVHNHTLLTTTTLTPLYYREQENRRLRYDFT